MKIRKAKTNTFTFRNLYDTQLATNLYKKRECRDTVKAISILQKSS